MTRKTRWLSKSLVTSPVCYALFITERSFHRELKRLGIPKESWTRFVDKDAAVHFLANESGDKIALVAINPRGECSIEEIYGLLVHEAVHIWQVVRDELGEDDPGVEQEAYSIQRIAQELMISYRDQTKEPRQ